MRCDAIKNLPFFSGMFTSRRAALSRRSASGVIPMMRQRLEKSVRVLEPPNLGPPRECGHPAAAPPLAAPAAGNRTLWFRDFGNRSRVFLAPGNRLDDPPVLASGPPALRKSRFSDRRRRSNRQACLRSGFPCTRASALLFFFSFFSSASVDLQLLSLNFSLQQRLQG